MSSSVAAKLAGNSNPPPIAAFIPREISGTTGTITQADNGKGIYCTSENAVTLTVTGPFTGGFNCLVTQGDDGDVTFAQGDNVGLQGFSGALTTAGNWAVASLTCPDDGIVVVAGNVVA